MNCPIFTEGLAVGENNSSTYFKMVRGDTNQGEGIDIIVFNSKNNNISLNMTDRVVHEIGHNFTNQFHREGKGDYEYHQDGLQNRENQRPTRQNKIHIISTSKQYNIYDKIVFNPDRTHT